MLEAVAASAGSSYAAVRDEQGRLVSSVGEPVEGTADILLRHGGEPLARRARLDAHGIPSLGAVAC
jgi:hypothetical protein